MTQTFIVFSPLDGQALVSSEGKLVLGLSSRGAVLEPGNTVLGAGMVGLNAICVPGQDGHIGSGDACYVLLDNVGVSAHVVSCKNAPKLP